MTQETQTIQTIVKGESKMSESDTSLNGTASMVRSPKERKEILKKIINKTGSFDETASDNTILSLESCIEETDNINSETNIDEKIRNQEEVLLDSEMMTISSKVLKQCTRSLTNAGCSYNHVDFARNLVQYVKNFSDVVPEEPNWSLLEKQAVQYFKRTPGFFTFLGTLAPLAMKEINRKKHVVREAQATINRPENIHVCEKEEEGLEQTLVLHPSDFGKTIENILQVSFLVRDGKVSIAKDASGILVVQTCSKEVTSQAKDKDILNIQNVVHLNMRQWKLLKDIYRLDRPMIEFADREHASET